MSINDSLMEDFIFAAQHPLDYAKKWKEEHKRPVVGILPMNFPAELAHAAGALPVVLQEDDEPVTIGLKRIFSFYCGFNRSLVNQTVSDAFQFLDAILLGDHCVQLLGTADVMRNHMPEVPVLYDQLVSTIEAPWAFSESRRVVGELRNQLQNVLGVTISNDDINASVEVFNKSRALLRSLYDMRMTGKIRISSSDLMHIVQASMTMDRAEHTEKLEKVLDALQEQGTGENSSFAGKVPVFLSGHMCHAPKKELLDLVEECGGLVVADDLYTGYRYISTDVEITDEPLDALTNWYLERNKRVPCPTRSAREHDWHTYLLNSVKNAKAQGVIILMVKFCEPHMYFYPEIKEAFEAVGIPNLLIETEHEEMPMESVKTRLETFMEMAGRASTI